MHLSMIRAVFALLLAGMSGHAVSASVFDEAAKRAAASEGGARSAAVDELLTRLETAADAPADDRLSGCWQAFRLAVTDGQRKRLAAIAAGMKDARVRNLLFNLPGSRESLRANAELLLAGREFPPKTPGRELFGDNPFDARSAYERWDDPDGFVGRYQSADAGITVDVLGEPAGNFRARARLAADGAAVGLQGFREDGALRLIGPGIAGLLKDGTLALESSPAGAATLAPVEIARTGWIDRPAGATVLLDETTGLENFTAQKGGAPAWSLLPGGVMECRPGRGDVKTRETFSDFRLHLEFRVPYNPESLGQMRGNSGVFLLGAYEVQVLDSFGLDPLNNEAGGLYKVSAPSVNMAAPPLKWQSYLIDFTAPRFDAEGKKIASARATVWHNGVKVQDDVEIPHNTINAKLPESAKPAPIEFQDHLNRIQYRNIWVERKTP